MIADTLVSLESALVFGLLSLALGALFGCLAGYGNGKDKGFDRGFEFGMAEGIKKQRHAEIETAPRNRRFSRVLCPACGADHWKQEKPGHLVCRECGYEYCRTAGDARRRVKLPWGEETIFPG